MNQRKKTSNILRTRNIFKFHKFIFFNYFDNCPKLYKDILINILEMNKNLEKYFLHFDIALILNFLLNYVVNRLKMKTSFSGYKNIFMKLKSCNKMKNI